MFNKAVREGKSSRNHKVTNSDVCVFWAFILAPCILTLFIAIAALVSNGAGSTAFIGSMVAFGGVVIFDIVLLSCLKVPCCDSTCCTNSGSDHISSNEGESDDDKDLVELLSFSTSYGKSSKLLKSSDEEILPKKTKKTTYVSNDPGHKTYLPFFPPSDEEQSTSSSADEDTSLQSILIS